jgi:hypothetical protein
MDKDEVIPKTKSKEIKSKYISFKSKLYPITGFDRYTERIGAIVE